mmetsp:Transcript_7727/g.22953  ORF Transcript_7727/g.22953 Transcript_7727/m.22953 type:complete len:180 (+) Transcript_7727:207-746(+)
MGKGARRAPPPRDFFLRADDEPHATRRTAMLKKYPEIKALFGHEPLTKYCVAATVALQVLCAGLTRTWRWPAWWACAYVVGATANHSLFLAIHELAHGSGAKTFTGNRLIAMVANLPITIAYCITFKPYHMAHHRNQGLDGVDTDIPTRLEAWLISGSSMGYVDHTLRKMVFMFFQIRR